MVIYLSDIHPGGPTDAEVISEVISQRPSGAQVIFQGNFQAATGTLVISEVISEILSEVIAEVISEILSEVICEGPSSPPPAARARAPWRPGGRGCGALASGPRGVAWLGLVGVGSGGGWV